jgi:hypothetical protein
MTMIGREALGIKHTRQPYDQPRGSISNKTQRRVQKRRSLDVSFKQQATPAEKHSYHQATASPKTAARHPDSASRHGPSGEKQRTASRASQYTYSRRLLCVQQKGPSTFSPGTRKPGTCAQRRTGWHISDHTLRTNYGSDQKQNNSRPQQTNQLR